MPTYEYKCSKCGTITEVFQPITEAARRKLRKSDNPQCDCDAKVTRLLGTGGGIIFKGSGFYETDYRSDSYKKAAEADKESGKKKAGKDGDSKASKDGRATSSKSDTGKKTDSPSTSDTKST